MDDYTCCPKCKSNKVRFHSCQYGMMLSKDIFQSETEATTTVITCQDCNYILYDKDYQWYLDNINAVRKFTALAKIKHITNEDDVSKFLKSIGIPLCFHKGGVYYVE